MSMRTYSSDPRIDRSLRHSIRDGVALSVMTGGGASYFSAFALHFKASASEIGILTTLPTLIGSFFQLASVMLGRRLGNRRNVILVGALLQVLSWLPLTLLPILFPEWALVIILGSLILFYAAGNLITPQWTSLMGDLVPERKRGRYFAHRSRLASVTGLIALVTGGFVLQLFSDSPFAIVGFISLFATAAVARMVSAYHMWRMVEPPTRMVSLHLSTWWRRWRGTSALRFTGFVVVMQASVAIAGPFFTVYMLRDLNFTYVEFMVNTAVSVLVQFLTLRQWGRVGDAFGHRLVMMVTGFLLPVIPALWMLSGDFWYLLVVQLFSGWVWGGFTLSSGNLLYEMVEGEERVPFLAVQHVALGIGTFAGALFGGWLLHYLPQVIAIQQFAPDNPLLWLFLISALARLLAAAAFLPHIPEQRLVRAMTWRRLVFRMTGLRSVLYAGRGRVPRVPPLTQRDGAA